MRCTSEALEPSSGVYVASAPSLCEQAFALPPAGGPWPTRGSGSRPHGGLLRLVPGGMRHLRHGAVLGASVWRLHAPDPAWLSRIMVSSPARALDERSSWSAAPYRPSPPAYLRRPRRAPVCSMERSG
jgi:hypothetical protein